MLFRSVSQSRYGGRVGVMGAPGGMDMGGMDMGGMDMGGMDMGSPGLGSESLPGNVGMMPTSSKKKASEIDSIPGVSLDKDDIKKLIEARDKAKGKKLTKASVLKLLKRK